MVTVIVIVIIIIIIIITISRMKLYELELGTLNIFLSWLELHKTALLARVHIDVTWWCGFI